MKRLLIALVAVVAVCGTASAWAKLGHATIAKIAEQNLTPKAKKYLTKYLDGKSIAHFASHADYYKKDWLVDVGFEPSNAKRVVTYPHTLCVNEDFTVPKGVRDGDKLVKNCVYYTDQMIQELKANHREMDDSVRFVRIAIVLHMIGDMHCPAHIRYKDNDLAGKFTVYYKNQKMDMHELWDNALLIDRHPWGFSDLAALLDTFDKKQKAEIMAGTIYDWGYESARCSRHVHDVEPGTKLQRLPYMNANFPLLESQLRKAGYRLAAVLNDIFK